MEGNRMSLAATYPAQLGLKTEPETTPSNTQEVKVEVEQRLTNNRWKQNRGWPTRPERSTRKRMKDSTKGDGWQKSTTAPEPECGKIDGRGRTGPGESRRCRAGQNKMGGI